MPDFAPVHPGEILRTEFLEPFQLSAYQLARAIDVPQTRLSEILRGRRSITADTGLRLSKALGLSDMFWINMQARYDAETAKDELADRLASIEPVIR
jgi:antitoxin HigA-1